MLKKTVNLLSRIPSSHPPPPHALCGFLAGLHSHGPDALYKSFDDAYEAVIQVDLDSLKEFEEEIWKAQSRRFIHGTRDLSVVDTVDDTADPHPSTVRQLIINVRPNLVQTAITVPHIDAPYVATCPNPSPLTQGHFGGLAMALPIFQASSTPLSTPPRVHIIGAGGCSLPTTLSFFTPHVTAVEPDPSVVEVAKNAPPFHERPHLL
ncbi:hypothetical protein TrRE_jg1487 [Triparma retinervis]|uniref:Uncharacterized protein n=1 Tax=Triparma retinervis TaxID=2557542 RepID=A0A9W6ZZI2_9STRA|nr:hypothetical protein TrRE_jg1487 [Triparma retinervis]